MKNKFKISGILFLITFNFAGLWGAELPLGGADLEFADPDAAAEVVTMDSIIAGFKALATRMRGVLKMKTTDVSPADVPKLSELVQRKITIIQDRADQLLENTSTINTSRFIRMNKVIVDECFPVLDATTMLDPNIALYVFKYFVGANKKYLKFMVQKQANASMKLLIDAIDKLKLQNGKHLFSNVPLYRAPGLNLATPDEVEKWYKETSDIIKEPV